MTVAPIVVFEDRDGDHLRVVARDHSEYGNAIGDPVLTIVRDPGTQVENKQSVVFTEDEFKTIVARLTKAVLDRPYGDLADLTDRLVRAEASLRELAEGEVPPGNWRLAGKIEGVKLAIGYVTDAIDAVTARVVREGID